MQHWFKNEWPNVVAVVLAGGVAFLIWLVGRAITGDVSWVRHIGTAIALVVFFTILRFWHKLQGNDSG